MQLKARPCPIIGLSSFCCFFFLFRFSTAPSQWFVSFLFSSPFSSPSPYPFLSNKLLQIRRNARERKEYLYRKTKESQQREEYEKKKQIRAALAGLSIFQEERTKGRKIKREKRKKEKEKGEKKEKKEGGVLLRLQRGEEKWGDFFMERNGGEVEDLLEQRKKLTFSLSSSQRARLSPLISELLSSK